jgi:acyl-lipid omega-6 desaturase (Delta-12 desaturase)
LSVLQGKDLILATRPFAVEIRRKSWTYTLSTLFLLAVSFTALFLVQNLWIRIPISILTGLIIVRMFVIYHDHQHHTILHKSKTAEIMMTIFGILILAPTSIWRRSHDYHHKHNSKLFSASIGSYPIVTKKKFLSMPWKERFMYLFTRHPLTIMFGYLTMFIIGMCINSFTSNPKKHLDSLIALVLHIILTVVIIVYFGWIAWLLGIVVPMLIACAIGSYLFYAQHNFPGVTFSDNVDWNYETAALESSSYMAMNPIMRWFTANIGYHHIHHLNAKIPFYRLPEVMDHFKELQGAKQTSLKPGDIIACFRLKVWDPERNQMVGLRAIRS